MGEPDRRGLSSVVGYALTLGIVTLLVTGLLWTGGGLVDGQRTETVRGEFEAIGQLLATDLATADRLVRAGDGETVVTVRRSLPVEVAGASYTVELVVGTPARLVLTATDPEVTVVVHVRVATNVVSSTASGGPVAVVYTGTGLKVRDG